MSETATIHPINRDEARPAPKATPDNKKKPTKILPSGRMPFDRQLLLLRAYATAYAHYEKPMTTGEVSTVAKIPNTTISTANQFLLDVGLIERQGGGFVPSQAVIAFNHAFEWNPETAAHKLAPILEKTWFAKLLIPKVMMGSLSEDGAITVLAEESNALKDHRGQLKMLTDYLEKAGLIKRENDSFVRSGNRKMIETSTDTPDQNPAPAQETKEPAKDVPRSTTATTFNQTTMGTTQFSVNVRVDMAEFAGWEPARITAFFGGIAQVLAAKAGIEQNDV